MAFERIAKFCLFYYFQPENIMLLNKNSTSIKLIDFGLAQIIGPNSDVRAMMGTAEFVGL